MSGSTSSENPSRTENRFVSRAGIDSFVEKLIQEAINQLDNRVKDIGKQTVVDVLGTCDVDYKLPFFQAALRFLDFILDHTMSPLNQKGYGS